MKLSKPFPEIIQPSITNTSTALDISSSVDEMTDTPVAVFDRQRVRDELCFGWETDCVNANLEIERRLAGERGNYGNFRLFYLPFLDHLEYGHERTDMPCANYTYEN